MFFLCGLMVVPMSCVLGLGPAQPTGRRGELYRGSRDMLRATARRTLVAVRWPGGSLLHSVSCLVFAIGRCVSSVVYEAEMGFVIPYMAVGWKIRRANGGVQPAPHGTKRTGRQKGAAQKERATGPDWVRD
jgi:hypothetical protein